MVAVVDAKWREGIVAPLLQHCDAYDVVCGGYLLIGRSNFHLSLRNDRVVWSGATYRRAVKRPIRGAKNRLKVVGFHTLGGHTSVVIW